jgi:PAS domain S-box-containing protein
MVAGLNAVVWERDPATRQVRFVSDRIEELLGYPTEEWLADPALWERIVDPGDLPAALAEVERSLAEGGDDFALTYRARARDGRAVWLRHLGHVTRTADGTPETIHAVLIDVTDQQRREQTAAVLAEAGRLLTEPGTVEERLGAIAGLAVGRLSDRATVWLRGDDGRFVAVAAAPAEYLDRLRALAAVAAPPALEAAYRAGRPFVVGEIDDDLRRAAAEDSRHYSAIAEVAQGSVLTAPLVAAGQVVGLLTLVAGTGRRWDDADLALAAELGQRIATMVAAERMAARQQQSQQIATALSAAGTVAASAAFLATGLRTALGAELVTVCTVGRDGLLHVEHVAGHPDGRALFGPMPLAAPLPLTEAVRTGRPVWIPDRESWDRRFPEAGAALLDRTEGAAVLPLAVGDRVLGAVGLTFRTAREFDPAERAFLLALAGQAAVAFERAALADTRREVADTLQHSLLPGRLPSLERLAVTARYLPGQQGTQAGGDWYDVLPLSDGRVALVVGDVVGNGAAAAAVMGQLRSALAMLLLEGHAPASALDLLDRFAARVVGARVSTAAVLLLDPETGRLVYSRAGHPPPLVLGPGGARALDAGLGPALDVSITGARRADAETRLRAGETLLLYTDGLVERRDAPLDDGLERLAAVAAGLAGAPPAVLVGGVLEGMFDEVGPADDVAVVAARLVPTPLLLELAADPAQLHLLRRGVADWAAAAGVAEETLDDLLLAVGEAVANAVEHAYPGGDGSEIVQVTVERDGDALRVAVGDTGTWRPPPADPGFRGRGLKIIRGLASDVSVLPGPRGTTVRFRLPTPPSDVPVVRAAPSVGPGAAGRPADVIVSETDGRRRVRLSGEFDLAGVLAVRDRLLTAVAGAAVVLDLGEVDALLSVGMGLLLEAVEAAGPGLEVVLPAAGPVRRALDLTGLTPLLSTPR